MKHFLGSVGVRGSVRGPFFTRHRLQTGNGNDIWLCVKPKLQTVVRHWLEFA